LEGPIEKLVKLPAAGVKLWLMIWEFDVITLKDVCV
jgi:hypothetical protein